MFTKLISDWSPGSNKLERLWLLAKIEFKMRYYENRLGLLWALLKPVLDICIYYIAFKVIIESEYSGLCFLPVYGFDLLEFFPRINFRNSSDPSDKKVSVRIQQYE